MKDEKTVQIPDEWLVPTVPTEDALAFSPGRYRLCFEVASGGMATVYLALYSGTLGFERAVALKTIHRHLAKEKQFVEMFLDEARIAAHIDHPFVCKVVDFGEARDSYYLAMEFLVGEPLSEVWEALQAQPARAADPDLPFLISRIAADLAEGLHAAHELTDRGAPMGIVHRDVTPANLFVLFDGTVRVVDFGIAKAANKLHNTETGTVKGKFAYLSPEQLSAKRVDRRSDVFSLGVVMWELLTGRRLFKHTSPLDTMRAVASAPIEPPAHFRKHIPAALNSIVLRALSRDPNERFDSARDMALALESVLADHARAVSRAEIGGWLDELLPGHFHKKRQLVELTRRGDTAIRLDEPESLPQPPLEATTVHSGRTSEPRSRPPRPPGGSHAPALDNPPSAVPARRAEVETPARVGGAALREQDQISESSNERNAPTLVLDESEGDRGTSPTGPTHGRPRRTWLAVAKVAGLAAVALAGGAFAAYRMQSPGKGATATPAGNPAYETDLPESPSSTTERSPDTTEDAPSPRPSDIDPNGEPGTLHILASPGEAEIWEDGTSVGHTGEDVRLPPGVHQLELRPDDESEPRRLEIEIRSGRRVYTSVNLGD